MKPLKPIETIDTNVVFTLKGYGDLPAVAAHDENGTNYIITAWEIAPEELKEMNESGVVYLSIVGTQMPPVCLSPAYPIILTDPEDVEVV